MGLLPKFIVEMDVCDILYISYLVPVPLLRPLCPDTLSLYEAGRGHAFLSVVCFKSRNVRVKGLPFLRFDYNQINIRIYVTDPLTGRNAVLFLRSGITSRVVPFLTDLLNIPWERIRFSYNISGQDQKGVRYLAEGDWNGGIEIELEEDMRGVDSPLPAEEREEIISHLTVPKIGFYNRGGRILRFEVEHTQINPLFFAPISIEIPKALFNDIKNDVFLDRPHNIIFAPYMRFTVFMPPKYIDNP